MKPYSLFTSLFIIVMLMCTLMPGCKKSANDDAVKSMAGRWLCGGFVVKNKLLLTPVLTSKKDTIVLDADTIDISFPGGNSDSITLIVSGIHKMDHYSDSSICKYKIHDESNGTTEFSYFSDPADTILKVEKHFRFSYFNNSMSYTERKTDNRNFFASDFLYLNSSRKL